MVSPFNNSTVAVVRNILASPTANGGGGVARQQQPDDPYFEALRSLNKLVKSPFADSLRAVVGAPSVTRLANLGRGGLGQYRGVKTYGDPVQQDTVDLSMELFAGHPVGRPPADDPAKYRRQPEYALAHEMGHRMEAVARAAGDSLLSNKYQAMEDSTVNHAIQTGSTLPDDYWLQSVHEHYAEAFAQAVTVLRKTATQTADPQQLLARADSVVPGTRMMVQKLLANPIYARHPLNTATPPTIAPRDAVRVP